MYRRTDTANRAWRPSGLQVLWVSTCLLLAGFCLVQAAAQPSSGPRLELCGVADIKPGDNVLAFNHATGRTAPRRVLHTMHSTSDHLRILTTTAADGTVQEFQTTNEHPFWVVGRDDYVEAKELRPVDKFRSTDGELVTVTASVYEPHPEGIAVYNFEVEGLHNYFVKRHGSRGPPVLAHNAKCVRGKPGPKTAWNAPHNKAIRDVASKVKDGDVIAAGGGYKGLHEKLIRIIGGIKSGRRPDVLVRRKDGTLYGINVGKVRRNGSMIMSWFTVNWNLSRLALAS